MHCRLHRRRNATLRGDACGRGTRRPGCRTRTRRRARVDVEANAVASLLWNSGLFTDSVSLEIDRGGVDNSAPTHADPTFREMVTTGQGGSIVLDTFVNVGKGSGHAHADPVFGIDPSFASVDPDHLSHCGFTFSPGIGNAPAMADGIAAAVPEPSSRALMLAGVATLGSLARRRHRA